ncbi:MAG: saccharopine dehydrogenase NADP-binding domain-containing protein [Anaerolineaceae bacterium]|nr:saccharopine dehydrogenase NADP-binding domain-containing protein [Anaerolineaceae bacterium]
MQKKVIVLGAGLVGNAMAIDLNHQFEVTAVDLNMEPLTRLKNEYQIHTLQADLSDENTLKELISGFDLVIGAVPGFMGYKTLKLVIEAGKDIVDISFFPEDPFSLDALAKEKQVTAIMDCGVAPGMGNIILNYHNQRMQVETYKCFVGGLPVIREWPFEYKAVFSPIDVIEEYIRPARYVENGNTIIREALSDPELIHFDQIGTLEAWNSDGLRTLIETMQIPDMIEKTLRYPGTIEYLRVLRESGFFSYDEIEVNGNMIRPIDLTSKLLFPKWKLKPGESDLTVMKIHIDGIEKGMPKSYTYDLLDYYDKQSDTISMARTTGYTATAAANLVLNGKFDQKGLCPPEYLGADEENFRFILDYLGERGVKYTWQENDK